jgi:hypothetical protein
MKDPTLLLLMLLPGGNATAAAWQCGLLCVADSIYHYLLSAQRQSFTGLQSSHSGHLQQS